ncbi:MAG TPA: regulatory iron-sulfur-containing complex subunit RicT, partial [Oscillospiraceae bacterium]|nr:regulatory iron-sulfur-containing complex subunit RicT [Oscillospiraceae bacterium]
VSIKMAKEQGLSLNPAKISGTCGRLMCCLKYEQEGYEELIRTMPRMGSAVKTPEGTGTVIDINLMTGKVTVRMDDTPDGAPKVFDKTETRSLRKDRKPEESDAESETPDE